jgi:DNA-binding transcriptional ArsR family regulator
MTSTTASLDTHAADTARHGSDTDGDPILDEVVIDDIEVLEQLVSPVRLRILYHLRTAQSVRELADAMSTPVTRLYYHIGILLDAGVITVIDVRKRGAQLEKVYRITGHSIRPSDRIVESAAGDARRFAEVAAGLVLDSARAELTESLTAHAEAGFDPARLAGSLGRTIASIPADHVEEVIGQLEAFITDLKDCDREGVGAAYGFTYAFFPIEPPDPEGGDDRREAR